MQQRGDSPGIPIGSKHAPAAVDQSNATDPHRAAVLAHLLAMPPVAALQPSLARDDDHQLVLSAPLVANINDKGCAFGGSLVSLMTLAGWSLVTLRLLRAGLDADVFVAESQVQYLKPLYQDLRATAWVPADAELLSLPSDGVADAADAWQALLDSLRERGRGRIRVHAEVTMDDGQAATRCQSRYAAILRR